MKKMLMAFALCASMMLPGQDNPPEGMDTLSFPLVTFECIFPANHDDETDEERAKRMAEEEAEQKEWDKQTEREWKAQFSEKGLKLTWPEGSSVVRRRDGLTAYLRVTNTPDNLVKIVKYFNELENGQVLNLLECNVRLVGAGREALKAVGFEDYAKHSRRSDSRIQAMSPMRPLSAKNFWIVTTLTSLIHPTSLCARVQNM